LSYKERVKQVFSKQIPCAFSVYSSWYGAWWYWLLLPWILPFQIAYCGVLLAELLLLTIFLPVTLIPYLDFLLFIVQFLSFVCCYIVALSNRVHPSRENKKIHLARQKYFSLCFQIAKEEEE